MINIFWGEMLQKRRAELEIEIEQLKLELLIKTMKIRKRNEQTPTCRGWWVAKAVFAGAFMWVVFNLAIQIRLEFT